MNALTTQINRLQTVLSRLPDGDRAAIESEIAVMFDLQQSIAQAALQGMIGERDSAIEALVKLEDAIENRDQSNPLIRDLIHEVTEEAYENGEDHGYSEGEEKAVDDLAESLAKILDRDVWYAKVLARALFNDFPTNQYAQEILAELLVTVNKSTPHDEAVYVWVDKGEEW